MDARLQRTLLRVGVLLVALTGGTAIIVLFPELDPRLSGPILGLTITAALGLDQWLKNSGELAAPTVAAVNTTLQTALENPLVSVPPPKEPTPTLPTVTELPPG
jgi:hypothetical protein